MGLFKKDYSKPGPGVPKNAPKKTGLPRFFEVLGRDFTNIVKLNLLYALCTLPAMVLFVASLLAWDGSSSLWFLLLLGLALVASIPTGPALGSLYNGLTGMLRDEPGFIWHNFKTCFKKNFRCAVAPGLVYSVLVGAQTIAVMLYILARGEVSALLVISYLFGMVVFNLTAPYLFIQITYLDAGPMALLKNSLFLAFESLPRSFAGLALGGLLSGVFLLLAYLFPPLLIVYLLCGAALPCLVRAMWLWPVVDRAFGIDKTLKERKAAQLDESLDVEEDLPSAEGE